MAIVRRRKNKQIASLERLDNTELSNGEQARQLFESLGLNNNENDLFAFVKHLGIRLIHKPMPDDQSGFMRKNGPRWEIGINSLHHPNRQRFTLAHELGHYFLHRNTQPSWMDTFTFTRADEKSDPMEWQANQFAAEFLMPKKKFLQMVANGVDNVDDLAKEFKVSTMAVRIRAKNLGFRGHGLEN